jgi:hypothetical protein
MWAQRESKCVALLIENFGVRWWWVVRNNTWPLYSRYRTLSATVYQARWVPESVRKIEGRENTLALSNIWYQGRSGRSLVAVRNTLHRLTRFVLKIIKLFQKNAYKANTLHETAFCHGISSADGQRDLTRASQICEGHTMDHEDKRAWVVDWIQLANSQ